MVIAIIIILLLVGVAIVGALYSSFFAFYVNFGDTLEYNKAYYAAISALERAELVLRYRKPWYQGSGGWLSTETYGTTIDHRPSNFGYFFTGGENGMLRTITSRTKKIPSTGQGNVEWTLVTGDALDYNKLDYLNAENFIFSLDESNNSPYKVGTITGSQAHSFTGNIRLPLFLTGVFGMLAATAEEDIGKDGIYDDPVVDWSFYGTYSGEVFQVLPTVDILYTTKTIQEHDSVIREKKINELCSLNFGSNKNPFSCQIYKDWSGLTIISAKEDELTSKNFSYVLQNATGVQFRLSLLNLLTSEKKLIYPYLEYQFSFSNDIADRFYKIDAMGKYGAYEVRLLVQKPTIKESILGSFTVIF